MQRTLLAIALLVAAGAAGAQQPDAEAQRAAMEKVAWLAGSWEGNATTQGRDGEQKAVSFEWVRRAAGGLALMIHGRHHRQLPDGGRGDVVHETAGMISFDPASGKYRFATQLQDGRSGTFEAELRGDTFSWKLPLAGAHVRYDIVRNERAQWSELGHFCRDGAACVPFFRMTLDRKGEAQ